MATTQELNRTQVDTSLAHSRVQQRLASTDQRYTKGRRQLVELLLQAARPVTLPDIAKLGPELPISSVYRNLEILEQHGLVKRIATTAEHARFELSEPILDHHHHLICVACGQIDDIKLSDDLEALMENALESIAETLDFSSLYHTADLHGRCKTCKD